MDPLVLSSLIGVVGFIIGTCFGMIMSVYIPSIYKNTIWFMVESKYEWMIADKLGHIPRLEISPIHGENICFFTIGLIKWFDFEKNSARCYHEDLLKKLSSWDIKIIKSGVY